MEMADYTNSLCDLIRHSIPQDPELFELLASEELRQKESLILIAAASSAYSEVLVASASDITNVTLEGYPEHRWHAGTIYADKVEQLAIDRAKKIFKAKYANVQPLSGAMANNSILFGLLSPGDTILGMDLKSGGHLTHGSSVSITGKYFNSIHYGLDKDLRINYAEVARLAKEYKPKIIIAGASSYSRLIDYKQFREIADSVNSLLLADMSHIAGLVASGVIPSPIDYAHIVTTSTYKQLYGPRGGLICMGQDFALPFNGQPLHNVIDKAVFPGVQSTPSMSSIAAKAAAFKKIDSVDFKEKMYKVRNFAQIMAKIFVDKGYHIISGGTDNHMILIDMIKSKNMTGIIAEKALEKCNIIINKNLLPNDTKAPNITSGIRIGTNTIAFLEQINNDSLIQIINLIDEVLSKVKVIDDKNFELDQKLIDEAKQKVKLILTV